MNTDYMNYLKMVILVALGAVIAAALIFIVKKSRRHSSGKSAKIQVDGGNVSIFFDRKRNAIMIPYVPDKYKAGKATDSIVWLDMPYKTDTLGRSVKDAMISCKNAKPVDNTALMDQLGTRGWKEFTEGKLSISVYYREDSGILMNSTVRTPEGAYVFMTKGPELCLPAGVEDAELGDALLELLKRCR